MRNLGGILLLGLILSWMANRGVAQQVIEGFLGGPRATYEQIHKHMQRQEYQKALAVVEPALRINPNDPILYELLGDVCANLEQSDRAIEAYTTALQRGSRRYSTYMFRGVLYSLRDDWDSAIDDFNEAILINPKEPYCYYNRGQAYKAKGQYAKARADLESAYARNDEGTTVHALVTLLATCPDSHVRDGRLALKYAREACEKTGLDEYFSLSLLAAVNAEAEQWEEAVNLTKQALMVAKGDYRRTSRIRLESYREHEPFREFTLSWIANHESATAGEALLYALVKDKSGDRAGAIRELRKAIVRNPRLSEAHFLLGERILYEHTIEAAEHFSRCLELNPEHSEALAWRGIAEVWLGKNRVALNDAEAALRLDPKDPNALSARLWALANCGEVERVLREIKKSDQGQGKSDWRHSLWGHCYLLQERFNEAISELTEALRLYPTEVLAYADRAVAFSALGKDDDAKRDFEECIRRAPDLRVSIQARMKAAKNKASSR